MGFTDVDELASLATVFGDLVHKLRGAPARIGNTPGSAAHVAGLWRYEHLNGVGLWTQPEAPQAVSPLLLDFLGQHRLASIPLVRIGAPDQQVRAHTGLGHAHRALNVSGLARHHYQHALELYTGLGAPQADQVRSLLNTITARPRGEASRPTAAGDGCSSTPPQPVGAITRLGTWLEVRSLAAGQRSRPRRLSR